MTAFALRKRPLGIAALLALVIAAIAIGTDVDAVARAGTFHLHALRDILPAPRIFLLGALAGAGAGLLAGLIGIGGGVVVVPAVYYGLAASGMSADQAAHVAIGTSLAAILPAALASSFGHWRAGNTDFAFLRAWGPGIIIGVVAGQLAAAHLPGGLMTAMFGLLSLVFAARFAFPRRFHRSSPALQGALRSGFRLTNLAGASIGLVSGLAGVGGGIMTNIVMSLSGLSMHRCVGRAAAVGVVVSVPATIVAALGPGPHGAAMLGSIDLAVWICIAPTQAVAAWFGARLARHVTGDHLSRIMAAALIATGAAMLRSSMTGG